MTNEEKTDGRLENIMAFSDEFGKLIENFKGRMTLEDLCSVLLQYARSCATEIVRRHGPEILAHSHPILPNADAYIIQRVSEIRAAEMGPDQLAGLVEKIMESLTQDPKAGIEKLMDMLGENPPSVMTFRVGKGSKE